jgi:hypothetical protein
MSEELEHVRRPHLHRIPINDGEEHLQVERHRPHRVRSTPPSHELEIAVHKPITKRVPKLTGWRHGADETREGVHPGTLTAGPPHAADAPGSPVHEAFYDAHSSRCRRVIRRSTKPGGCAVAGGVR